MIDHMLGKRLYFERLKQGLTLRHLARKTGVSFSNINRIEQGLVNPKKESLEKLMQALHIKYRNNALAEKTMSDEITKMYHAILFVNYNEAKVIARSLKKHEENYMASPKFIDYLLVFFMYAQHVKDDDFSKDSYYQQCELLEPVMNDDQRDHFYLEKGLYLYLSNKREEALNYLLEHVEEIKHEQVKAQCFYLIGGIYKDDYRHYNDALKYLNDATMIFEKYTNYNRSNRAKAIIQTVYVYTHRFDQFEILAKETFDYAKNYNIDDLFAYTTLNMARYYIMKEDYKHALDYLDSINFNDPSFQFLKMYSYYVSSRTMEALHLVQSVLSEKRLEYPTIFRFSFNALEYALVHGENDHYVELMRSALNEAFNRHDFLMTQLLVKLFVKVLETKRKYKEALNVTEKLYDVMRKII